ncbi:hypothetical protein [Rhodoblastus sp.]|uniref:hypothetical protein n=1 Tax=Rhodoblastus sp. TaxID=1962975 RepID=UPI0026056971|nr:hypothetical protein [Rhodoblastus sp.]
MRAKFLAASFFFLSSLAASAQSSHDGQWKVSIETTVGKCEPSAEAVVTITDNRVTAIDASGIEPWGYIDEANTFVGHFSQGERVLRANGDVKGDSASGPWSSNTDFCGGRWTAHKIN